MPKSEDLSRSLEINAVCYAYSIIFHFDTSSDPIWLAYTN